MVIRLTNLGLELLVRVQDMLSDLADKVIAQYEPACKAHQQLAGLK